MYFMEVRIHLPCDLNLFFLAYHVAAYAWHIVRYSPDCIRGRIVGQVSPRGLFLPDTFLPSDACRLGVVVSPDIHPSILVLFAGAFNLIHAILLPEVVLLPVCCKVTCKALLSRVSGVFM